MSMRTARSVLLSERPLPEWVHDTLFFVPEEEGPEPEPSPDVLPSKADAGKCAPAIPRRPVRDTPPHAPEPLVHIVYGSAAAGPTGRDGLRARTSRTNNTRAGITGLLLYSGGTFIQALEGPPRAVEATFARIQRDPRHGRVEVFLREAQDVRHFPDWPMGFAASSEFLEWDRAGFTDFIAQEGVPAAFREAPWRAHRFLLAIRSVARPDSL